MRFLAAGGTDAPAGERLATALGRLPPHPPAASLRSSPRHPDGDHAGPASDRAGPDPWGEPRANGPEPWETQQPHGPEPWETHEPDGPERWATSPPGRSERWGAIRRLLESGRADPGLPGARALALAGVGAALVAGGYLWLSRPHPEAGSAPVSAPVPAGAASLAVPAAARGPGPVPGTAGASPPVVVHVAGRVRRPGVVTLSAGARVTDAITAAGGVRPGAGTGPLNLARKVVDGEQILVGVPGTPAAQAGVPGPGGPQPGGGA
ncbi:SLBB domain-containing protein, partial [Actinomadura scrupuli]|uniref:SLBB domain-containing protein n=1 Tax=Actinomadura scrupuli TaxID=559629 RepID=UPI003D97AB10